MPGIQCETSAHEYIFYHPFYHPALSSEMTPLCFCHYKGPPAGLYSAHISLQLQKRLTNTIKKALFD